MDKRNMKINIAGILVLTPRSCVSIRWRFGRTGSMFLWNISVRLHGCRVSKCRRLQS